MTVIPRCSVLQSLERIVEAVSGGKRALCQTIDTIHVHSIQLSNAMPMDACPITTIDLHPIVDLHGYSLIQGQQMRG